VKNAIRYDGYVQNDSSGSVARSVLSEGRAA